MGTLRKLKRDTAKKQMKALGIKKDKFKKLWPELADQQALKYRKGGN